MRGPKIAFEQKYRNLGMWGHVDDHAAWTIDVPKDGTWNVELDWACADETAGNHFIIAVGDTKLIGKVPATGNWDTYRKRLFGTLELKAGRRRLIFRSDGALRNYLIDLRSIRLWPAKQ